MSLIRILEFVAILVASGVVCAFFEWKWESARSGTAEILWIVAFLIVLAAVIALAVVLW
jgi:hypothetical protein